MTEERSHLCPQCRVHAVVIPKYSDCRAYYHNDRCGGCDECLEMQYGPEWCENCMTRSSLGVFT